MLGSRISVRIAFSFYNENGENEHSDIDIALIRPADEKMFERLETLDGDIKLKKDICDLLGISE